MALLHKYILSLLIVIPFPTQIFGKAIVLSNNKPISKQIVLTGCKYIIKDDIDLRGDTIQFPKGCVLKFKKGSVSNGLLIFDQTKVAGTPRILCGVSGTIANSRTFAKWFIGNQRALDYLFTISDNKRVYLEKGMRYQINYLFTIPTCVIYGNGATIELLPTLEHAKLNECIKIRNRNYEGNSIDRIEMYDISFMTETDRTYLFNLQNTRDCRIKRCTFTCNSLTSASLMHCFDVRGNNSNLSITDCTFKNSSAAKEGGCLWLRSFGEISDVHVLNSSFYNNCMDEFFAINAVASSVKNIFVEGCNFEYQRDTRCQEPHVLWGMTTVGNNTIDSVTFNKCRLTSNFLPLHILNAKECRAISIINSSFDMSNALMNSDGLTSVSFTGPIDILNSNFRFIGLVLGETSKSNVYLFSSNSRVVSSAITNDSGHIYLGGPNLEDTYISFDNSVLFVESLPTKMERCEIHLGPHTPRLAANPYAQSKDCNWTDNVLSSDKTVQFNFTYKKHFFESNNNKFDNIELLGAPFKEQE